LEWEAFQLDPAAVKATDETAQVTFARFRKEAFAFTSTGVVYRFGAGELVTG
jgi:hypothetical protein